MLQGTYTSLKIFFLTLIFSLPLGLLVAKGRMSKNRFISISCFINLFYGY